MTLFQEVVSLHFEVGEHVFVVHGLPARRYAGALQASANAVARAELQIAAHIAQRKDLHNAQTFAFVRRVALINQRLFAEIYGVKSTSISRWENGTRPVPEGAWSLLALLLRQDDPKAAAEALRDRPAPHRAPEPIPLDYSAAAG
jgi:DNA-binding transcriptional regulator YiaG